VRQPLDIWKHNLQAEMDKDDCNSIAGIKQKQIEVATTTSCCWLNPRNSEKIIDFVT
jgi:hypothetical protein